MKYTLEMELQSSNPAIIFHNVIFDMFKINIIERYSKYPDGRPLLCEAKFKVRSTDDRIFKKQNGDVTYNFRDAEFYYYKRSTKLLKSCRHKKVYHDVLASEQEWVHFLLKLVLQNYQLF